MKKAIIFGILSVLVIATVVYAANQIEHTKVLTCSDSDGGLSYFTIGTVSGSELDGTPYSKMDYCIDSQTVAEYGCSQLPWQNRPYRDQWIQNCEQLSPGSYCNNGRCH